MGTFVSLSHTFHLRKDARCAVSTRSQFRGTDTSCRREPKSSFPESRFDGRTQIVFLRALRRFNPKNGLSWETESETLVSKKPEDFLEAFLRSHPNPQEPAPDLMVQ